MDRFQDVRCEENRPAVEALVRIVGYYFKKFKNVVNDNNNAYFKAASGIMPFTYKITQAGQLVNTPYAKGPAMTEIILQANRGEEITMLEGLRRQYGNIGEFPDTP
jgi:hypothetical protein